jgi:hypothetical protein
MQVLSPECQAYMIDPEATVTALLVKRLEGLLPFPPSNALVTIANNVRGDGFSLIVSRQNMPELMVAKWLKGLSHDTKKYY